MRIPKGEVTRLAIRKDGLVEKCSAFRPRLPFAERAIAAALPDQPLDLEDQLDEVLGCVEVARRKKSGHSRPGNRPDLISIFPWLKSMSQV